jgi:zinc protease
MITRALPKMYPGSKYGVRMPIGLMSVVDNFKPKELKAYYQKWYRPDNQAIIVVGDIDVDYTEAKIKELFSGIVVPADAAQVVDVPVPDNEQAIYIFDKDKEQAINQIMVFMKHDTTTPEEKSSISYLIEMFAKGVIGQMLSQRLNEMTQNPDCPFFQAVAEDGQYMISKTKDAFQLIGVPKEGRDMETLQALIREAKRARDFGFTATEYERAKADYLAMLEKQYTNRNKIHNDQFGNDYRDNYLTNEPIPSIEMLYQIMNSIKLTDTRCKGCLFYFLHLSFKFFICIR